MHSPINRESMCKPTSTPDGRTVYKCPFCSKDFLSFSDINRHMDFHEGKRKGNRNYRYKTSEIRFAQLSLSPFSMVPDIKANFEQTIVNILTIPSNNQHTRFWYVSHIQNNCEYFPIPPIKHILDSTQDFGTFHIWASMGENLSNNTGADQPAHMHRLVSAFVIGLLESFISRLAMS